MRLDRVFVDKLVFFLVDLWYLVLLWVKYILTFKNTVDSAYNDHLEDLIFILKN